MTVHQVPIFGESGCSCSFCWRAVETDCSVIAAQLTPGQKRSPPIWAGAAPLQVLPLPGETVSMLTNMEAIGVQVSH